MKKKDMLIYIFPLFLIGGFYYLAFKNSPKYANMWLLIVAVCICIGFIQPQEKFSLIAVALGIVGLFYIAVKSRNVRAEAVQDWFSENGFQRINFSLTENLFNTAASGTINYYPYTGEVITNQGRIPLLMAIRHSSSTSGNSVSIILDCSYYFKGKMDVNILEQKFKTTQEKTPHTNLWKSQLRFFDLKDCEIFKPAMGGIVVSWRVPDTVEGYNERYEWIKNALQN